MIVSYLQHSIGLIHQCFSCHRLSSQVLAWLVVTAHVNCAFMDTGAPGNLNYGAYRNPFQPFSVCLGMIGQSFLMALIFFLAGYFTPASCDRRGVRGFLRDRFLPLGVPFALYTLGMGPALDVFVHDVAVGRPMVRRSRRTFTCRSQGPRGFLRGCCCFQACMQSSMPLR